MGEAFFENLAGLGSTYGDVSRVHPLALLVLFDGAGTRLEGQHAVLAWAFDRLLLPVAKVLGFEPAYGVYRSLGAKGGGVGDGAAAAAAGGGAEKEVVA